MKLSFSIIVPIYNRPQEIDELLESISEQNFTNDFEVIIVEDGSSTKSNEIIYKYINQITIRYFEKENSGPGDSRNYGIKRAKGNYFIILDSDVILPKNYLQIVYNSLQENFTDAFGGPDAAHQNFTPLQKAINYSMTSFITTGGIRGKKKGIGKFQLRSFNLGISKKAFKQTKGFSNLRAGEDIDLTFRLWRDGFATQLIPEAFVYHKRRNTISSFYKQTFAFGKARPKLNRMYPSSAKFTFWLPSLFLLGFGLSLFLLVFKFWSLFTIYIVYFLVVFLDSFIQNKNLQVALLSIITSFTQFLGYGLGFLKSQFSNQK